MRRLIALFLIATLAVVGVGVNPASAQSGDAANAYNDRHFAEHYDQDTIQANMYIASTSTTSSYFYMQAFRMQQDTNGFGGYMGFQTNLHNCQTGQDTGKGFVFSFWNAPLAHSMGTGGYSCSGTEVGQPYVSIHMPFNWTTNTWYAYYAARTWNASYSKYQVCVSVYNYTTAVWTYIGCILQPVTWSWFLAETGSATQLVEEYNPNSYADCNTIPVTRAVWGSYTMHSYSAGFMSPNATFQRWIEPGKCPNSASYVVSSTDVGEVIGATS